ncbi:MAG: hypothetical protein OXJ53_18555 [Gammaproteobacteria bacterium]|nr:hypothetical protein [Gammaproteobacteria bacterium]
MGSPQVRRGEGCAPLRHPAASAWGAFGPPGQTPQFLGDPVESGSRRIEYLANNMLPQVRSAPESTWAPLLRI